MKTQLVCFILLTFSSRWAFAQGPEEMFPIAGTVVDAVSGHPVVHVRMSTAPYRHLDQETGSAITGEDGRFEFHVNQGKYQLRAEPNGMPRQTYNSGRRNPGFGMSIVTGSDQKTANLIFRLFPPSAISGRVVDESGEAVENALVQLLRSAVAGGRRRVTTFRWAYSNDLGEYRFGNLGAGTYFLAVTGRPWYSILTSIPPDPITASDSGSSARIAGRGEGAGSMQTAYAPVYYPNTGDARTAAPLVVKAGEDATADFTLIERPGSSLSVRLQGTVPIHTRLSLIGDGIQGVDSFQRVIDLYGPMGNIPAVPLGHYIVRVVSMVPDQPASGFKTVDIGSSGVALNMTLSSPSPVAGTVQLDSADAKIVSRLQVSLRDDSANRSYSRNPEPNGSFTIPSVLPGTYRVTLSGPDGFFARQVLAGDREVTGDTIEIGADATLQIRIVASNGVGRLNGFVYQGGESRSGVLVVLAPVRESSDPGNYRGFETDSDGSFDFQNLRPGEYRLFALESEDFEYANPVVVRPYLKAGKSVTIEAQGTYSEKIEMP